MKKVAVLVSGGGTNLQALIDAQKNGILTSGKISLVISNNENAFALQRAKKFNIKTEIVTKKQFNNDRNLFEQKLIEILKRENIDYIVLAGFMVILSSNFTNEFKDKIINVHPSLIPSFCGEGYYGLRVHEEALKYGVKVTGATVHYVNEIPDGGKIIMQKAVIVNEDDTPETLQKRVMQEAEWQILPLSLEKICSEN